MVMNCGLNRYGSIGNSAGMSVGAYEGDRRAVGQAEDGSEVFVRHTVEARRKVRVLHDCMPYGAVCIVILPWLHGRSAQHTCHSE